MNNKIEPGIDKEAEILQIETKGERSHQSDDFSMQKPIAIFFPLIRMARERETDGKWTAEERWWSPDFNYDKINKIRLMGRRVIVAMATVNILFDLLKFCAVHLINF